MRGLMLIGSWLLSTVVIAVLAVAAGIVAANCAAFGRVAP